MGNLSQAQAEKVRQYTERTPLYDELRDRDRKRMQAEFVDMIRKREAQKRLPELDRQLGARPRPGASRRERALPPASTLALLLELDKTLDSGAAQPRRGQFRRYAEDFRVLAAPGPRRAIRT